MPTASGVLRVFRRPADGADGVSYELTPSVSVIAADSDGNVTTGVITLTAYRRDGDKRSGQLLESDFVSIGDHYYAEYSVDGGAWTEAQQVPLVPGFDSRVGVPASAVQSVRSKLGLRLRHSTDGGTPLLTIAPLQVVRDGANGSDGEPGADGKDSVRRWLVPSATQVRRNSDGTCTPEVLTVLAMEQVGSSPATKLDTSESGMHEIRCMVTLSNHVTAPDDDLDEGNSLTTAPEMELVEFTLWDADETVVDTVTVPVVGDGPKGDQGLQGCIYRTTEWAEGFEYHNDEHVTDKWPRYIDIVVVLDSEGKVVRRAQCRKTHRSDETNKPGSMDSAEWILLNDMTPIYTPLIVADSAVLRFGQTNQWLVVDENSRIVLGAGGGEWPLWVGASTPEDAPFRVGIGGELEATKANIQGVIKATSGSIGNWLIRGGQIVSEALEDGVRIELQSREAQIVMVRGTSMSYVSPDGVMANWAGRMVYGTITGINYKASIVGMGFADESVLPTDDPLKTVVAGVYGTTANKGNAQSYGGYFEGLMAAGLCLKPREVGDGETVTLRNDDTMVIGLATGTRATVNLPSNPRYGQVHFFKQYLGNSMMITPTGGHGIRHDVGAITAYEVAGGQWVMAMFYGKPLLGGVWLVSRI